jgi:hypothetical protein
MMKKTIRDYIKEKFDYMNNSGAKDMEEFCEDEEILWGKIAVMDFISNCGFYYVDNNMYWVEGINIGNDINLDFMDNAEIKEYMIEYIDEWRQEWLDYEDDEYEERGESVKDYTNIRLMNHYAFWYGVKELDDEFFEELLEDMFRRNNIVLK